MNYFVSIMYSTNKEKIFFICFLSSGLAETFHSVTSCDLQEMSDASDSDSISDSDDSGIPENKNLPLHGSSLKFHPRHGKAIELLQDGKVAMRRNALSEFDNGVVLTHRPLEVDELFEVSATF